MKLHNDGRLLEQLRSRQGGVFSTADLRIALADPHAAGFARRVARLIDDQTLHRFARGFYVAPDFDLFVLSQRIAPRSVISFETVLAAELVIGTQPKLRVVATKVGRPRTYSALGFVVEHVGISSELCFGSTTKSGVRFADKEKAVLDVLYFHLRGRRFAFDIYSDLNHRKLDLDLIETYLGHYRNPKFISFARRVLELG